MKKICNLIFILVLCIIFNIDVKAEGLKCMYDYSAPKGFSNAEEMFTSGFTLEEDGSVKYQFTQVGLAIPFGEYAPQIIDEWLDPNTTNISKTLNGKCPKNAYACLTTTNRAFIILNTDIISRIPNELTEWENDVLNQFQIKKKNCFSGILNDSLSNAEGFDYETGCTVYTTLIGTLLKNFCADGSECDSNKVGLYNKTKDELKNFCKMQLSNGNSFDTCINSCIHLSEDIASIEKKSSENNKCSFSENLLGFINNILKWVKYLVPAIIIILSILDFIKAIGADKDEEMKKAQQKFMKRLVIAVLIFIIPFILEFVLDKMGFVAEGCGIIEF